VKRASILALWFLLAAATVVPAQDTPAPQATPPASGAERQDTTGTPSPAPPPEAAAGRNAKSPESFVPSEEISEDLSVSFPVDI
jgi:hypothetical protein